MKGGDDIEANKTYVIIHIQGVLTANIKIPKSYLKSAAMHERIRTIYRHLTILI